MGLIRSNCIVEAWREYMRLRRAWKAAGAPDGGEPYIWIRSSRLTPHWVPHVGIARHVSGQWQIASFKPVDDSPLHWWQVWRAAIYVGRWVDGDAPH